MARVEGAGKILSKRLPEPRRPLRDEFINDRVWWEVVIFSVAMGCRLSGSVAIGSSPAGRLQSVTAGEQIRLYPEVGFGRYAGNRPL